MRLPFEGAAPRAPRVALIRESLWMVRVPRDAGDRAALADRRGILAFAAYALYTDATEPRDFEAFAVPVLRTMASSRSRTMLVLTEEAATFDAGRVRQSLQEARERGLTTLVEIAGTWPSTLLELLAAAAPTYVRVAPDLIRGVSTLPDVFRSLVRLAEFAHERGIELVARNPGGDTDLDAVRAAGVGLVQWGDPPLSRDEPGEATSARGRAGHVPR